MSIITCILDLQFCIALAMLLIFSIIENIVRDNYKAISQYDIDMKDTISFIIIVILRVTIVIC